MAVFGLAKRSEDLCKSFRARAHTLTMDEYTMAPLTKAPQPRHAVERGKKKKATDVVLRQMD